MLFSLNVGKVDAGVAVLLTEDMRVIEFPSILLPEGIKSGSIVDINVSRNHTLEATKEKDFRNLQQEIWETFGKHTPQPPVLRVRNTTQTAVVLEWDPLELATAKLRSLSIYRNGEKMGNIPDPLHNTSTKISGLAIDREYTFQLELRTSSGQFKSELIKVHTHKMTNLSGIRVTAGVMPEQILESLEQTVESIGAQMADGVKLDTTHFVCTEGKGKEWEKAKDSNIPVVRPEWVDGCKSQGRLVGVRDYYLDANPKNRPMGSAQNLPGNESRVSQATPTQAAQISRESISTATPTTRPAPEDTPRDTPSASSVSGEKDGATKDTTPSDEKNDDEDEEEEDDDDADEAEATESRTEDDDGDIGTGYEPAPGSRTPGGSKRRPEDDDRDPGTPSNFEEVEL